MIEHRRARAPERRSRAAAATGDRAVYDVLMRRRQLAGDEDLDETRARVDALGPDDHDALRDALRDEAALCMRRMEQLGRRPS